VDNLYDKVKRNVALRKKMGLRDAALDSNFRLNCTECTENARQNEARESCANC